MPTLVVQLGHCYRKTGATGTTGEQEYATKVGNACRALLHGRGGWSVRTILADDALSLYRGDAFVAVHCDGSTSAAARGASVGYRTPEGQAFGQAWKRAYDARGWDGFRPDNYTAALSGYYGTGNAVGQGNRRAVILECGFRTNAEDRALLDGPGGPERVALSIGDALGIPVTPPEDDVELTDSMQPFIWPHGAAEAHPVGKIIADGWSYAKQAAADTAAIRAAVGQLTDDEAKVLAAVSGVRGELLAAIAAIDGTPSDEQIDLLAERLNAQLGGAYNVTITRTSGQQ